MKSIVAEKVLLSKNIFTAENHNLISGGIAKLKSLFRGNKSRSEVVATFLSVLELCKIHSISVNQDENNEYRVSYLKMPDESEVRE